MENENLDSLNEENDDIGNDDITALQEKYQKLSDSNRKLFARAKKAEGFEWKDEKWVKVEKLEPKKEPKEPEVKIPEKSNELDYGQRAFLKTYGIAGADELALVKSWTERTGDQIDTLVEDEIFNAKLKGLRDQKAAKETLQSMSNSRNAQPSSKSKAEFWLDKPFDEVPKEFQQEVLNIKLEREREGGKFTDQPVVKG